MSKTTEQRSTITLPEKKAASGKSKPQITTRRLDLLLLKEETAPKLGKFDGEVLRYQITKDTESNEISLRITSNSSGGYFSREFVPVSRIETTLAKLAKTEAFPSKALADVFAGRSSNNAGFIAAILRHEDLLGPANETDGKHKVSGDVAAWKKVLASLPGNPLEVEVSEAGIPLAPPKKKDSTKPSKWPKGTAT
jgi:hypothetical protein